MVKTDRQLRARIDLVIAQTRILINEAEKLIRQARSQHAAQLEELQILRQSLDEQSARHGVTRKAST